MKQMQGGQNLVIAVPVLSVGIMINKESMIDTQIIEMGN